MDSLKVSYRLGQVYADLQEWESAIDAFCQAAKLDPGNAEMVRVHGLTSFEMSTVEGHLVFMQTPLKMLL